MYTTTTTVLALLTSLSATVSALPQPQPQSSLAPTSSSSSSSNKDIFVKSFGALYNESTAYLHTISSNTAQNENVYTLYASTGDPPDSYNASSPSSTITNSTQPPITQMEVAWLPKGNNSTQLIDSDNFTGNKSGEWTYATDNVTFTDSQTYRVITPKGNWTDLPAALDLLSSKFGANGPWNELSISWPALDLYNGTNGTGVVYQFSSYSNATVSYVVGPDAGQANQRISDEGGDDTGDDTGDNVSDDGT